MNNVTLPGSALNISAYMSEDKSLGGQNSSGILPQTWIKDNETFNFTYFDSRKSCQNIGVSSFLSKGCSGCLLISDSRTISGDSPFSSCSSASYCCLPGQWEFTSCGYTRTTRWHCATVFRSRSLESTVQSSNWQLLCRPSLKSNTSTHTFFGKSN